MVATIQTRQRVGDRWERFWYLACASVISLRVVIWGACINRPDGTWLDRWQLMPVHFPASVSRPSVISHLTTWDAAHYLHLAADGYSKDDPSCAFYPLWPTAIRLATALGRFDFGSASIVLANLLLLANCALIGRWFVNRESFFGWILWLCSPNGFIFNVPYSEGLCALLTLCMFRALRDSKFWLAFLTAFLLPLSRPVGILVFPMLAFYAWRRRKQPVWCLPTVALLLGYGLYFLVLYSWTGDALEGFHAQQYYALKPSIGNVLRPARFVRAAFDADLSLVNAEHSILDRLVFLFVVIPIPFLVMRARFEYALYVAFVGIVPAMSNWFLSYRRFSLLLFPSYLVYGEWIAASRMYWVSIYYCLAGLTIQIVQIYNYSNFIWCG